VSIYVLKTLSEADSFTFFHPDHDKPRRAVIIRVQSQRLLAIFGRGTLFPDKEHIEVPFPSQAAAAIGLTKNTYFYTTSVVIVAVSKAKPLGHCPPEYIKLLRPLTEKGVRLARSIM
jgi:hypothetical protein